MMEFEDAFNLAVFDNNQLQLVGAHCGPRGGLDEIWNPWIGEPIVEKCWMDLTTEVTQGMYCANITGFYERINPLLYTAHFDGCTVILWEDNSELKCQVDKRIVRSNIVYKLLSLNMKIGQQERLYNAEEDINSYGVPMENSGIEEIKFLIQAKWFAT